MPSRAAGSPHTRSSPHTPCPLPLPGADEANPSVLGLRGPARSRAPTSRSWFQSRPERERPGPLLCGGGIFATRRSLRRVPLRPCRPLPALPGTESTCQPRKFKLGPRASYPATRLSRAASRGAPGGGLRHLSQVRTFAFPRSPYFRRMLLCLAKPFVANQKVICARTCVIMSSIKAAFMAAFARFYYKPQQKLTRVVCSKTSMQTTKSTENLLKQTKLWN